ncbi:glycosyltransferase [Wenzhouxiangella sediminis]|uniref:Glycosyltransferase n=1 Tax=Wenzhouxiangella sediminis TaxID=1792836 RepID=A0A3E1K6C1_9GAMM|nr:glycosyltransferase [Wenzhouxiangella sediminis]RFF29561.1 glycosyltransferase [Wenzhouxiangella sediminis]
MAAARQPDICLVMIVRDEAHVIERCLKSVRPLITRWCIVDTGSADDTAQIIEQALADLPGELHHRQWVDFGHNRSEALALARGQGDWLLLIDADEELIVEDDFAIPDEARIQAWQIRQRPGGGNEFFLPRLLQSGHPWRFEGVLHEHLASDEPFEQAPIEGLAQVGHFDSARNRQPKRQKYLKDAEILARALETEPDNARYQFYLAQSLRDAGEDQRALAAYRKRAQMGSWDEEVYCAFYEAARALERIGAAHAEIVEAYLAAWNQRPQRAEPLVELARIHRQRNQHAAAHLFARRAAATPRPDDILFVDAGAYQWRAHDELAVASYWLGDTETARTLAEQLLKNPNLPETERPRIQKNLQFFQNP